MIHQNIPIHLFLKYRAFDFLTQSQNFLKRMGFLHHDVQPHHDVRPHRDVHPHHDVCPPYE